MRFLVDASSDARLVGYLRGLGHDVTRVGADHPGSLRDVAVLSLAVQEQRILITDDRDFGELVFRRLQPHSGVIYLRLETTKIAARIGRLNDVLTNYSNHLDHFITVTLRSVRVRSRAGTE
ncbi:MAG: hypothetical protein EXR50_05040 [Dehalococcoidia bacterium]|nr:hypothetical protein [Dehalococcoidia bacterium]